MRIAQVAPLYENVPPTGYGGTERVIAGLCDGLVAAGHDVTLFATGRSQTSARLESFIEEPLRERMDAEEMAAVSPHLHLRMLTDIYGRATSSTSSTPTPTCGRSRSPSCPTRRR